MNAIEMTASRVFAASPASVRWLLIAVAGIVVTAITGSRATSLWWGWDDLHYLLAVLNHSPAEYLFDPEYWKNSKILFTPLNILPYEINHYVFGLEPGGFYLHQLLAAWLLFMATVLFLRLWCNDLWAVVGASLTSVSAPVLITVYQIMCVHYLEGLLLSVLAVYLYVHALRKRQVYWTIPGGALYLLACAAKEIYIPLVLLLPFFPEATPRLRVRYWTAYQLALAAYLLWRYSVLGVLLSGYGVPLNVSDVASVPFVAVISILGGGTQGIVGGLLYISLLLRAMVYRWPILLFVAVLLLVMVAPLSPIAFRLHTVERALVLISWVVCVSLAISLDRLSRLSRRAAGISAILLLVIGTGIVRISWKTRNIIIRDNHRYRSVGEYVMREPGSHALLLTGNSFRGREAKRLRRLTQGQAGPGLLFDPMQLVAVGEQYDTIHWFDEITGELVDISGPDPVFMEDWTRRTEHRPLSLTMEKRGGVVSWEFGPYRDSRYDVVYLSAPFAFTDVHYVGRYPAPISAMDFVLRYQSSEGWITYSDVLHWDSAEGESLSWSR